jgi:hypothetical protein
VKPAGPIALLAVAGCALSRPATTPVPAGYHLAATSSIANGVVHRSLRTTNGPQAVEILEVSLDRCITLRAVKGFTGAIGRERTSTLLTRLNDSVQVMGGVNADFFLFTPPGVPTNAHVERSRLMTGPNAQPVFALDSEGRPYLGTLQVQGTAVLGGASFPIAGWNRHVPNGLALFDRNWGSRLDTASAVVELLLTAGGDRRVITSDTLTAGLQLTSGNLVLVAGRNAPPALRQAMLALQPGEVVEADVHLAPLEPREAVGGRPMVVLDSALTLAARDTVSFSVTRHPRTAVGVSRDGRRLWLVTVDGRQPSHSAGMSLLELGTFMRDLGAVQAINLDGGGSTAMVVRNRSGALVVVNTPSDAQGERAVGNALAVVREC